MAGGLVGRAEQRADGSQSVWQLQFLTWKAFQGDHADERRSIAGHLEETGLELEVPETAE
jgi:hypothetical protein